MAHLPDSNRPTIAIDWLANSEVCCKPLARFIVQRNFDIGDAVFHQGDECRGVYFLLTGLIGIRRLDAEGCSVLLHLIHPGEPLAYNSLATDEEYTVSAECLAPSNVGYIPKSEFHSILKQNPEVALCFLERAICYLKDADRHAFEITTMSARDRVIQLLLSLVDRYATRSDDGSLAITLPFSRSEMADIVGIRPETISRVVKQLIDEGLAEFRNRQVWVPNIEGLFGESSISLAA